MRKANNLHLSSHEAVLESTRQFAEFGSVHDRQTTLCLTCAGGQSSYLNTSIITCKKFHMERAAEYVNGSDIIINENSYSVSTISRCHLFRDIVHLSRKRRPQESVGVTSVLVYTAQLAPVVSTVICAALSWPLAHAPPLATSSPFPLKLTSSMPLAVQSSALNSVPLKPTQAFTPTRSALKSAVKVRWTLRADVPEMVVGVIWRSADVLTHAASTISPFRLC